MRKLKFQERSPLPSLTQLEGFEKKYKISLPKDYAKFLLDEGGGTLSPENNTLTLRYKKIFFPEPYEVEKLYSILSDEDDWTTLEQNYESYLDSEYYTIGEGENYESYPNEFMPIGSDGCGTRYCIGVKGSVFGKVFILDEDGIDVIKEHPKHSCFYCLARSFPVFLRKLKSGEKFFNDPMFTQCHFSWVAEKISYTLSSAEMEEGPNCHLVLNQDLGADAWSMTKIRIPSDWVIEKHHWDGPILTLVLASGKKYYISHANQGQLFSIQPKKGPWAYMPDKEIEQGWDKYGAKEEASKELNEPVNLTIDEWMQMRLNMYGEDLLRRLDQPNPE